MMGRVPSWKITVRSDHSETSFRRGGRLDEMPHSLSLFAPPPELDAKSCKTRECCGLRKFFLSFLQRDVTLGLDSTGIDASMG